MIVQKKDGYHLMSSDGSKHLGGPYSSREEAIRREKQVQYFKHIRTKKISKSSGKKGR